MLFQFLLNTEGAGHGFFMIRSSPLVRFARFFRAVSRHLAKYRIWPICHGVHICVAEMYYTAKQVIPDMAWEAGEGPFAALLCKAAVAIAQTACWRKTYASDNTDMRDIGHDNGDTH